MGRIKDSVLTAVLALLKGAGAKVDSIDANNHTKIKWSINGHKNITVAPKSESDHRAKKNVLSIVKRQLKESDHEV
jgi:hypothetical protein